MYVELSKLPTHVAQVGRRLNITSPDDLANLFLRASYLAEVAIKTVGVVVQAGLSQSAREHAYRFGHQLVRADGLGAWEATIREVSTQPLAGYLPAQFASLIAWFTARRTKPEDEHFRRALESTKRILQELGADEEATSRPSVRDLMSTLVRIRNKTKAHGAVGDDFFSLANRTYIEAIVTLMSTCPAFSWRWMHLSVRQKGNIRGVLLSGESARYMTDSEIGSLTPSLSGVHFVPDQSPRAFACTELLRSNLECTEFMFPNGGMNAAGQAEFINYGTGKVNKCDASSYLSSPVPLPGSETEGMPALDIQSNVLGNLPPIPSGYVQRKHLQEELERKLLDTNHPIITLHGGGGMGKTSVALYVAHRLTTRQQPPFEHVVWFSARDVDLRPRGPSLVRPSVLDLTSVSKTFGALFALYEVGGTLEAFARVLHCPKPISEKGILFIFDNFETMSNMREIHRFLDEHTHIPNKVLITSRERAFVADYPIEVRGMEFQEAEELMRTTSRELSIESLVTKEVIQRIYDYTGGHAYVMRVVIGEIEKERRYEPPAQVMGRRADIVDAVFERSFNKLSDAGKVVFLTVGNWKSEISELALIVVLGLRGIDVESGIDECRRLSFLLRSEMPDENICYSGGITKRCVNEARAV